VANWVTNSPGSSDYFLFSAVTYANEAKIKVLGVQAETLNRCGAVHEETAEQMAQGARRVAGATYGLATTGIAGPDGGTADKPVGTVCLAWGSRAQMNTLRLHWPAPRALFQTMVAATALDLLRRQLLGIAPHPHYVQQRIRIGSAH
jgi:nicotinamide-nucleotide amidase